MTDIYESSYEMPEKGRDRKSFVTTTRPGWGITVKNPMSFESRAMPYSQETDV